ncbi:MAG: zeta toxin family protein [Verrucomicrobiota bacterium]
MSAEPLMIVVAGSNGAGKSTFVARFLGEVDLPFINADELAKQALGRPAETREEADAAAARAQEIRDLLITSQSSFITETVLSDPVGAKVDFFASCEQSGYRVEFIFIGIENSNLSRARVMQRVEDGGHDVPDEKIDSRFPRTLENLKRALTKLQNIRLFDNSFANEPYRLVAEVEGGVLVKLSKRVPRWAADIGLETLKNSNTKMIP